MNNENCSENELIQRAIDGDKEAFSELAKRFAGEVFNLSYRITGNCTDAEDLSQSVFLRVFETMSSFKFKSGFSTWLYRVTINIWIDSERKRKKNKTVPSDTAIASNSGEGVYKEITDLNHITELSVEKKELELAVRRALDALAPEKRLVVILKYIEKKSLEEMRELCGSSIGTISSRLTRALREVRKYLRPYMDDDETQSAPAPRPANEAKEEE